MILIGGIELNKNLIWEEPEASPRHTYSRKVTLQGRVIVQFGPINGRLISLSSVEAFGGWVGYFTYEQIMQLKAFEEGLSVVPFVYNTTTLNVLVEPGGIAVSSIVPRPVPELTDWYTGTINLIEVGG